MSGIVIEFMSHWNHLILFVVSLIVVGFGQPAFSLPLSLLASVFGFAIFWKMLIEYQSWKRRFLLSTSWFFGVQLIQLSWMISHPYLYIFGVLFFLSFLMGVQFGIFGILITKKNLDSMIALPALAGFWTFLEWSRLHLLSGFSWNPAGIALTGNVYSLQFASIGGIYLLSFWVILVNLFALKALISKKMHALSWLSLAMIPFFFGFAQIHYHREAFENHKRNHSFEAILVQTAFPVEETIQFKDQKSMVAYVLNEWRQILKITKKHLNSKTDLIALPEYAVPYGTYSCVFPYPAAVAAFREIYGPSHLEKLPPLKEPYAMQFETEKGHFWMVNNAFWAQGIANIFNAELIAGLEDVEQNPGRETTYYSAAIHFMPQKAEVEPAFDRYEKRVLVPMGEYIPSEFLKKLARSYGIAGSFTPGKEAKILGNKYKLGLSICYEETFGNLMRENKLKGADALLNLTSDVWYPNSRLTQQHFDHARPRTVENGLPLIRACNTGITAVVDCFGRISDVLGESPRQAEWQSDSIKVSVPTYRFNTPYSYFGDYFILAVSAVFILLGFRFLNP